MTFDLNGGFSLLTLKKPFKPIKIEAPRKICLHTGENEGQYQSFLQVINDLALAFKFLPDNVDKAFKLVDGTGYQNLDFCPEANQWDLIEGENINSTDISFLDDINEYFNWDAIKSIGGSQSYYQIANSTAISSFTDEQAFNFMCSMLESKERVFGALTSIFGGADGLENNDDVIGHITSFLDSFNEVDPHNMSLLNMFFRMQTGFINALDAYLNCQTYWGGDLSNPFYSPEMGGFSDALKTKVESYISSPLCSGEGKIAAAKALEDKWFVQGHASCTLQPNSLTNTYDLGNDQIIADSDKVYVDGELMTRGRDYTIDYETGKITFSEGVIPIDTEVEVNIKVDFDYRTNSARWDKVGDTFVRDLRKTDGSWVKFFEDKMDEFNNEDVVRIIAGNMMYRSEERKYKSEQAEYESKKDDLIQDEIFLQKLEAKNRAASKKTFQKLLARRSSISKTMKAKNVKRPSLAGRSRPAPKMAPKPVVKHTPNISAANTLALKKKPVAVAHNNVPTVAHNQNVQAKKNTKDNNKVI